MKIRRFRNRCAAVLLSCFLGVGSAVSCYQNAYATGLGLAALGGGALVGGGEALAWLLATCGFVAASAVVYENTDNLKAWGNDRIDDLKEFVTVPQPNYMPGLAAANSVLARDVDDWVNELSHGNLDVSSPVWEGVKHWMSSIPDQVQRVEGLPDYCAYAFDPTVLSIFNLTIYKAYTTPVFPLADFPAWMICINGRTGVEYYLASETQFSASRYYDGYNPGIVSVSPTYTYFDAVPTRFYYGRVPLYSDDNLDHLASAFDLTAEQMPQVGPETSLNLVIAAFSAILAAEGISSSGSYSKVHAGTDGVYERDKGYENLGLVSTNPSAAVNTGVPATSVPIDWAGVGDVAGAVSGIATGEITTTKALADAGVVATDVVTDYAINDTGITEVAVVTAVAASASLGQFTIPDLATVFPFCLPFDLIDFFALLQAPPEAPHFTFPIPYPTLHGMATYNLTIDFSPFEPVAEIFRMLETLGFIIGLIMITRNRMIRG